MKTLSKKAKISVTTIPIFFGNLVLIKTNDFEGVLKKYSVEGDGEMCAFSLDYKNDFIIAYKDFDWSVLVHEIIHVVNMIMKSCRIPLDYDNDETQAYLAGWVTSVLMEFENIKNK